MGEHCTNPECFWDDRCKDCLRQQLETAREALDGADKALAIAFDHLPDEFNDTNETFQWMVSRLRVVRNALRALAAHPETREEPPARPSSPEATEKEET